MGLMQGEVDRDHVAKFDLLMLYHLNHQPRPQPIGFDLRTHEVQRKQHLDPPPSKKDTRRQFRTYPFKKLTLSLESMFRWVSLECLSAKGAYILNLSKNMHLKILSKF